MGGVKKKPVGASAKAQDSGPQAAEVKDEKKGKKDKGAKGPQQKAKISVILNEGQGMKALAELKAITPQALARNTGVKISVANAFLKSLESKGTVVCVGGYSGHKVYALAQQERKESVKEQTRQKEEVSEATQEVAN